MSIPMLRAPWNAHKHAHALPQLARPRAPIVAVTRSRPRMQRPGAARAACAAPASIDLVRRSTPPILDLMSHGRAQSRALHVTAASGLLDHSRRTYRSREVARRMRTAMIVGADARAVWLCTVRA